MISSNWIYRRFTSFIYGTEGNHGMLYNIEGRLDKIVIQFIINAIRKWMAIKYFSPNLRCCCCLTLGQSLGSRSTLCPLFLIFKKALLSQCYVSFSKWTCDQFLHSIFCLPIVGLYRELYLFITIIIQVLKPLKYKEVAINKTLH